MKPLTKSKELDLLNKDIDDSLNIQTDESKVRRILINLISNSIKFTEKGYISVTCIEKENYLEFEVADTGIGIQKNEHDLIFEKFRQVDYSKTRQYEGIGLGLSIVKELVEMHNGTISVESDLKRLNIPVYSKKIIYNINTNVIIVLTLNCCFFLQVFSF